jgi:hypothetical protein
VVVVEEALLVIMALVICCWILFLIISMLESAMIFIVSGLPLVYSLCLSVVPQRIDVSVYLQRSLVRVI